MLDSGAISMQHVRRKTFAEMDFWKIKCSCWKQSLLFAPPYKLNSPGFYFHGKGANSPPAMFLASLADTGLTEAWQSLSIGCVAAPKTAKRGRPFGLRLSARASQSRPVIRMQSARRPPVSMLPQYPSASALYRFTS